MRDWAGVRLGSQRVSVMVLSLLIRTWCKREVRAELTIRIDHPMLSTRLTQTMMIVLRPTRYVHLLSSDVPLTRNLCMAPFSHSPGAVERPKRTYMVDPHSPKLP